MYFKHKHVGTETNCSHELAVFLKYHMPLNFSLLASLRQSEICFQIIPYQSESIQTIFANHLDSSYHANFKSNQSVYQHINSLYNYNYKHLSTGRPIIKLK